MNTNKNVKNKKNVKKSTGLVKIFDLVYPYETEQFMTVWNVLIKTKKWRNKENIALQASLKKLSEHTEQDAIKMMENSIAGEWQGLFELKNKTNGQSDSKTGQSDIIIGNLKNRGLF